MTDRVMVRPRTYRDSVALMRITREVSALEGVEAAAVSMATPLNIDLLERQGVAAAMLTGLGAGLTPEGGDLLASSGATVALLEPSAGFGGSSARACALARLERIGASTGRAYAVGAATACVALGGTTRSMTTTRATRQLQLQRS